MNEQIRPLGFEPLLKGYSYTFTFTNSEGTMFWFNLFKEFGKIQNMFGSFFVNHFDVTDVLLELHIHHSFCNFGWELFQIYVNFNFGVFVCPSILGYLFYWVEVCTTFLLFFSDVILGNQYRFTAIN